MACPESFRGGPSRYIPLCLSLALATLITAVPPALGHGEGEDEEPGGVVLIVVPALDAEETLDWLSQPEFRSLAQQCAVGVMNTAVPSPPTPGAAVRALLAGRPAPRPGRGQAAGTTALQALADAGRRIECVVGRSPLLTATRSLGVPIQEFHTQQGETYLTTVRRALGDGLHGQLILVDAAAHGPPRAGLRLFEAALSELDPERDLILLAAAAPDDRPGPWDRLSVVLAWSGAWEGRELTSPTTRTPGLVASVDLAATVLTWLAVPAPAGLPGRPVRIGPPLDLGRLAAFTRHAQSNRALFVPMMLIWGIPTALVGALAIWSVLRPSRRRIEVAQVGLAAATFVPGAFLLAGALAMERGADNIAAIVMATAALTVIALALGERRPTPFRWAASLTAGLILLDLARGGPWLRLALLSDFPLTGVRFYGIGNEYGGLLIGLGTGVPLWIGAAGSGEKRPPAGWVLAAAWWLASVALLGGPDWGANLGCTVAMAAAAGTAAWTAAGRRLGWKQCAVGAGALAALMAALIVLDSLRPPAQQTHLGRLAGDIRQLGWGHLWAMAGRKWGMSARYLTAGYFWLGLALVAPVLGVWYHKASLWSRQTLRRFPPLQAAVAGGAAGGLVAFLANDTGMVAGPLCAVSALVWWLDLLLETRRTECAP